MTEPRFSVVMPAWNTAWVIGGAIESVLAQTVPDFELLVVDDASTDGTADVVRRYADDHRVRLIARDRTSGPGAARNAAFALARAPFVSMLDSDDLWLPGYLAAVGRAFAEHPGAGLVCTGHRTLEEPPGLIRREPFDPDVPVGYVDATEFLRRLVWRNFVVNSTVTVRREALEATGGADDSLPAAVDYDLWLRLARAGYGAVCLPDALAVYRVRRGSIQNDPRHEVRGLESLRTVCHALAVAGGIDPDVRTTALERLVAIDRRLAVLRDRSAPAVTARRLRRRGHALKRRLLRRRLWYATPPPELAGAAHLLTSSSGGRPSSS